jgi:hypothetical protein
VTVELEDDPLQDPARTKSLWLRFIHAASELEALGFLRQYGKKGDMAKVVYAYVLGREQGDEEEGEEEGGASA